MDEENLLLNIGLGLPTHFDKIILDKKLWKVQEESILDHLQGGKTVYNKFKL